jgi:hypothetical protein
MFIAHHHGIEKTSNLRGFLVTQCCNQEIFLSFTIYGIGFRQNSKSQNLIIFGLIFLLSQNHYCP